MSNQKTNKSAVQIRIRKAGIPYRGKRIKARDYPGMLPNAQKWPWQEGK